MSCLEEVALLQSFNGHKSDVTCCDFAPNFSLVTGSSDKTVRVWDWEVGSGFVERPISPLLGHKYGVTCVRISPQGSMLATSSIDGTVVLWNLHSLNKIHTFVQVNGDAVRICRFAPDTSVLVTAGDNGAVCVWDTIHRSLIRTIYQHEGTTQALAFTPDSQYLITGCTLEVLRIWYMQDLIDTTSEKECSSLASMDNAHDLGILSMDVSNIITSEENAPLTKHYSLATSGNCETIVLWSITSHTAPKQKMTSNFVTIEKINELKGHGSAVTCVKYNNSGTYLVSSSLDKLIKVWNTDGICLRTLSRHKRYVNCVAFSRDSSLIVSGSNDKSTIVWDLTGKLTKDSELFKSHHQISGLLSNGVQEVQLVRNAESDVRVKLIERIDDISDSAINSCCFHGNVLLATGSSDKLVKLFRVCEVSAFLEELHSSPIDSHTYAINYVAFSKDGAMLATCSLDGSASIWNPLSGEKLKSIPEISQAVRVCKFSPDGAMLVTAGDDEVAIVWNISNMEKVGMLVGHLDAITSASFSPDGNLIATTCHNGDFRLWTLNSNVHVQDDAHDMGIQSCDFSQNLEPIPNVMADNLQNYLLATCGNDSLVKLWRISLCKKEDNYCYENISVKLWRILVGHGGNIYCVRFSPNTGEIVCSTATDRQARIWSVYSGDCLFVLDHDSIALCCSFTSNCSVLAVGCLDKTLWLWKLPQQLIHQASLINKIKCRTKAIIDWKVQDVIQWLKDIDLEDITKNASNASLDGQKLLTIPEDRICSGLDLDDDRAQKLFRELKWLKQDELQPNLLFTNDGIPPEFLCPITHDVMLDPVTCSDGFTYEKKAITEWFLSGKFTSPMTNAELTNTDYRSNTDLRDAIHKFLYGEGEE